MLRSLAPAWASDGLLRSWTAKETVVKALGVPLAGHLDPLVVDPDPAHQPAVLPSRRAGIATGCA